jgi:hypothetical protein
MEQGAGPGGVTCDLNSPHSHISHLRPAWAGSQTQNQPQKAQSSAGRVCLWAVGFVVLKITSWPPPTYRPS